MLNDFLKAIQSFVGRAWIKAVSVRPHDTAHTQPECQLLGRGKAVKHTPKEASDVGAASLAPCQGCQRRGSSCWITDYGESCTEGAEPRSSTGGRIQDFMNCEQMDLEGMAQQICMGITSRSWVSAMARRDEHIPMVGGGGISEVFSTRGTLSFERCSYSG